jgi:hypothetical protein
LETRDTAKLRLERRPLFEGFHPEFTIERLFDRRAIVVAREWGSDEFPEKATRTSQKWDLLNGI